MSHKPLITGMRAFLVVWIGQFISLIGSSMSGFGLTIWAYERTGSATALALTGFFFVTPMLVISPLAGALVDRSNRKLMMMLSDLAAGLSTLAIFLIYLTGGLEIWHLYVANFISGTFQAFQWPAYSSAITLMLPKEQYGRANGLMSLGDSASGILAPLMAGALLTVIGLQGILLVDIITFVAAIGALLLVFVPQPEVSQAGREGKGNLLQESAYGFRYILARPSLLSLQLVFLFANFFHGIANSIVAPLILARTANNQLIFASVGSAAAVGGVLGGLAMSAWGGTKRRIHGVLGGWILSSLVGTLLLGLGQALPVWVAASFLGAFFAPVINASNQAIWQAKVAPDVQGRVFATRRLIAWFVSPLAMLAAGPLADRVFEPGMLHNSTWQALFSGIVGSGPGAGIGLLFVVSGVLTALVGVGAYLLPKVRDVEVIMPDFDATA